MKKYSRTIKENIQRISAEIAEAAIAAGRDPQDVQLMAVTKTQSVELVNEAIGAGITLLGENRAQELVEKYGGYHREHVDIHFIGKLQTNKVRQIVEKVTMVHSVDSEKLAKEIDRRCAVLGKKMQVLLEVNIGGELSKSGVEPDAVEDLTRRIAQMDHLELCGLMAIPPVCAPAEAEHYFHRMHQLLVDIRDKKIDNIVMKVLSMGMSGDYLQAVRQGATIVRLGSAIFGERDYR